MQYSLQDLRKFENLGDVDLSRKIIEVTAPGFFIKIRGLIFDNNCKKVKQIKL